MKRILPGLLAALVLSVAPARAQVVDSNASTITLMATGQAETPAEFVTVTFKIRGEGKSQVEALKAMAAQRERIESGLSALAGATSVSLSASDIVFYEVRPDGCAGDSGYGDPPPKLSSGACAPVGYIAELTMAARLQPPEKLGNAASLLAQLGAVSIDTGSGEIADYKAVRAKATRDALARARDEAELVAAASGGRVGRVLRIQDPNAGVEIGGGMFARPQPPADALPRAAPVDPAVPVDLKVQPVTVTVNYIVVFELLK